MLYEGMIRSVPYMASQSAMSTKTSYPPARS